MDKILKFNIRILMMFFVAILVTSIFGKGSVNDSSGESITSKLELEQTDVVQNTSLLPNKNESDSKVMAQSKDAGNSLVEKQELNQETPKESSLLSQFATHNHPADCWIYYEGHIYDVSSYFGKHPGGDAIMVKYCGKDATDGFNTKEKGISHSGGAHAILAKYLLQ